jgi:hypothetical protein
LQFIPGLILPSSLFDRRSFMTTSLKPTTLALCHFCTAGHLPAGCGHFLPPSTISLGQNFPEDVSLAQCHCCTTGHLPAGGSQLLPGPTISSGQLLSSSRRPAARCRPLCRFFITPEDFTAASSKETSRCSTSDYMSSGFSSFPGMAFKFVASVSSKSVLFGLRWFQAGLCLFLMGV